MIQNLRRVEIGFNGDEAVQLIGEHIPARHFEKLFAPFFEDQKIAAFIEQMFAVSNFSDRIRESTGQMIFEEIIQFFVDPNIFLLRGQLHPPLLQTLVQRSLQLAGLIQKIIREHCASQNRLRILLISFLRKASNLGEAPS